MVDGSLALAGLITAFLVSVFAVKATEPREAHTIGASRIEYPRFKKSA